MAGPRIFYGPIEGDDWRELYRETVLQSDEYAEMSKDEREFLAGMFWDEFYKGRNGSEGQDAWFDGMGIDRDEFDWDAWRDMYSES